MKKIINPKDYDIKSECRIGVKNRNTNKFEELPVIKKNEKYVIPDKYFKEGILNYRFKIQVKSSQGIWKDRVSYFYLLDLPDFWNEKVKYSDEDVLQLINYYYSDPEKWNLPYIRYSFNNVVKHIESSPARSLTNLTQYFKIVDSLKENVPNFWRNINVYIKHLIRLRKKVLELKLTKKTFIELQYNDEDNNLFKHFLEKEIMELEKYNLKFADFLAGRHYSFFGLREKAASLFEDYLTFESPLLHEFDISKGVTSYFDIKNKENLKNIKEPEFISEIIKPLSKTTIVMSVDPKFLRKYGLKIFSNIIALKNYHVHFHVIGEESLVYETINQAKTLFDNMKEFYNTDRSINEPTYSIEECPDFVKQETTYYACSRFIHAEYFMSKFNTNILILDADYTILDDFKVFLNKINRLDVGMSIRFPMACMSPWTRNMGGSVFLKNNKQGRTYIKYVNQYIIKGLEFENSWILDQNALSYGMEIVLANHKDINIQNIPYEIKPFKQTPIRNYMEERFPL